MEPFLVVKMKVPVDPYPRFPGGLIPIQIDILVLHAPPQPLDEDVVVSPPPMVHADPGSGVEEDVRVSWACEVAPLVAVHYLRDSLGQGFLAGIEHEVYLHGVAQLPAQDVS